MKLHKKKIVIFTLILCVIIFTATMTSAKYVYNSVWNYYLKSKGFYFESDLLTIDTKKNSLLKWDGSNIYFSLKNSINPKLISEYDISYKISCNVLGEESSYIGCALNGTESSTFNGSLSSEEYCYNDKDMEDVSLLDKTECELNGYIWKREVTSKNNYFNLFLKDETKNIDEVSVQITTESMYPYHKTLKGIFNLNKIDEIDSNFEVNYQSFNEYDEVIIVNKTKVDKCFSIGFSSNDYLYDITNYSILNYTFDETNKYNTINIKVEKQKSMNYEFYKINSQKQYSIEEFIIEEKDC